jgi:hypothetical protein
LGAFEREGGVDDQVRVLVLWVLCAQVDKLKFPTQVFDGLDELRLEVGFDLRVSNEGGGGVT